MNLLLFEPGELSPDGTLTLRDRRLVHVRTVLRVQVGDDVAVGQVGGRIGQGIVRALDDEHAVLEVQLTQDPPTPPGIELVLAIPRPKILRRVLQATAAMGCKRLALVCSYRVEKSYLHSPALAPEAIREELILGLEQGRDTVLPEVSVHRFFKPFIEDELEAAFPNTRRFLPHPKASDPLPGIGPGRAVLAIGPEGGWTEYEAKTLEARGFLPFTAGPRILRVDVAVPYLFGQLALRR
ncbi:MAG: 16S rRNA (uracil(1498)-N(3))-methyltransferase [Deltaproteobacteria bacterium]|nr:16S rRNA (uracil(1498)-N(3))-methyltransferase [Deltaproteobacteria bacterium]